MDITTIKFPQGSLAEIARRYDCHRSHVRKGLKQGNQKMLDITNQVLDEYKAREDKKAEIIRKATELNREQNQ